MLIRLAGKNRAIDARNTARKDSIVHATSLATAFLAW